MPRAFLFFLLVMIFGQDAISRPFKRSPPKVILTAVREVKICEELQAIASTDAKESTVITSSVSEKIVQLHFEEGQFVREGDFLVTLSQGEEMSDLHSLEARLLESKPSFERSQTLFKKKVISKSSLEEKEANFRALEAEINAVKARLKDRVIQAPFDGIVGLRDVSPGSLVEPGDRITTLYDLSKILLNFEVPARYLPFIKPELKIEATGDIYPDEVFEGKVFVLSPSVDPVTRLISVKAVLDNPSGLLKPGLFMTVRLRLKERSGLVVPEEALVKAGDASHLYIIERDKKGDAIARQITVLTGERERGLVEITKGVKKGDQIVLRGLLRGQKKATVSVEKNLPFKLEDAPVSLNCRVVKP